MWLQCHLEDTGDCAREMGHFNGSGHARHPKAHFTIFNIHLVMLAQVKIAKVLQCKPQSHTGEMTEHLSGTQAPKWTLTKS